MNPVKLSKSPTKSNQGANYGTMDGNHDSGKIAFPGEKLITDESPKMEEIDDENDLDIVDGEISEDAPRLPTNENISTNRLK